MTTQAVGRKARMSVTIFPELKAITEEIAKENNTTPSGIVSQCLEELAQKRTIELLEEGYKTMANEHKQFAKLSSKAASEVAPVWK